MPIYEYKCEDCKKSFELFIEFKNINDDKKCPFCDSNKLKKLISACGFALNGSGFYKTDYKGR